MSMYRTPISSQHPYHDPTRQAPNHAAWTCNSPRISYLRPVRAGHRPQSSSISSSSCDPSAGIPGCVARASCGRVANISRHFTLSTGMELRPTVPLIPLPHHFSPATTESQDRATSQMSEPRTSRAPGRAGLLDYLHVWGSRETQRPRSVAGVQSLAQENPKLQN